VRNDRLAVLRAAAQQGVVHRALRADVGDGARLVHVEVGRRVVHRVAEGAPALGGGIGPQGRVLRGRNARPVNSRGSDRAGADRAGALQEGSAVDAEGTVLIIRAIAHAAPPRAVGCGFPRGFRGFRTIAEVGKKDHHAPRCRGSSARRGWSAVSAQGAGRGRPPTVSSARTIRAPAASASSLAMARSRGRYFIPQSGAGTRRSGGTCASAVLIRPATVSGVSTLASPRSMTPRTIVFVGSARRIAQSRRGWAASIEICVARQRSSSGRYE